MPRVIAAFCASLPDAAVYVYDNNSRDRTAEVARAAGARVRVERLHEPEPAAVGDESSAISPSA